MNNEKKAQEICEKNKQFYVECSSLECYISALEMAQWKDEQFSKFLLWLDDHYVIKRFTDGEPMTYSELIDNFKSNSYEHNTTKTD